MDRVIAFCASCSNTGKTTLVLRVLEELRRRGVTAAVLKHGHHPADGRDKDSSRYLAAGAAGSLYVSPWGWVLEARPEGELAPERAAALLRELTGCSLILAEGFKRGPFPRIAVCRREVSLALPCPERELWAVVSDTPLSVGIPQFRFEEIPALCDRILGA